MTKRASLCARFMMVLGRRSGIAQSASFGGHGFASMTAALLLLLLFAMNARATSLAPVSADIPSGKFYTGLEYRYQITETESSLIQSITLQLWDWLDVTAISCGGANAFDAASLAACSSSAPYNCAAVACPGASPITVALSASGSSQMVAFSYPGGGANTDWPQLTVAVRMHDSVANACGQPYITLTDTSGNAVPGAGSSFPSSGTENAACQNTSRPSIISIQSSPAALSAARAASPSPVTWQLQANLSDGSTVPYNHPVTAGLAGLQCAMGTAAYGSCSQAPFTSAITLVASQDFPATLSATAVNTPDPPPGNANVQITVPTLATPVIIPVAVEQSAALITTAEASNRTSAAAGEAILFNVTASENAAGGQEPRVATFSVFSASGAVNLGTAQTWLAQTAPGAATLTPPASLTGNENIVIRAMHTNPDLSVTAHDLAWTVLPGNPNNPNDPNSPGDPNNPSDPNNPNNTPLPGSCTLQASPSSIGPDAQSLVTLMVAPADGSTAYVAPFAPTWNVLPQGTTASVATGIDAGLYVTAPADADAITVDATFSSTLCANTNAAVTVTVQSDVALHLTADATEIAPMGMWHLNAQAENTSGRRLDGMVFALAPSSGLRSLQRLPMGGATATDHAATASAETLWFTAQVPAQGLSPQLSAAFLPRQSFACGQVSATLTAYRDKTTRVPIASTQVQATVRCDPEMDEATLVGRVYLDTNGDGRPQEDEPGLANVMVATSAGVYAITDAAGRYHIARLTAGRQAVKLNAATLPAGAYLPERLGEPTPADGRVELTLTPGLFREINFPVRVPDLQAGADMHFVPESSGVRLQTSSPHSDAGSPVDAPSPSLVFNAHVALAPGWRLTAPGAAVNCADSECDIAFPLAPDTRHYLLIAEADDGRTELASFAVFVTGQMVSGYGPRPLARFVLPSERAPLRSPDPLVRGVALTPGAQRWSTGEGPGCAWDALAANAPVDCRLHLTDAAHRLIVEITPTPDNLGVSPGTLQFTRPMPLPSAVHFFVGLAGGEVSGILPRGTGDDALDWRAGGAFFYRGVIKGKMLVTAGADIRRDVFVDATGGARSWSGVVSEIFRHDARRIFRDLDPEAYYPVYGDASVTVDERESGGRFFVRVQMDDNYVRWGALNTAIDDAEVGQYVRSLYGLGGRVGFGNDGDPWSARAVFFAAQPDTSAARDELWSTGGSLYFLAHRNVVEGSLRAVLEVLDTVSNLPMRAIPLTEGYDYEADYLGGRINLDAGLPTRVARGTLTSRGAGGPRTRLLVDYEYVPGGDMSQDWTAGARVGARYGPVDVGVTGVGEINQVGDTVMNSDTRYSLIGGTARFDWGEPLQARVEVAHSAGTSHAMASSLDGGLSFTPADSVANDSGTAVALEVSSTMERYRADVYGMYLQPGFTDSRTPSGTRLLQGGLRADGSVLRQTRAWIQADHREQTPRNATNDAPMMRANTGLVGAAQRFSDFELELEGRYQSAQGGTWGDTTAGVLGAQLSYDVNPWLTVLARRRQVIHASPSLWTGRGESAIGADFERSHWHAGGEVGMDDRAGLFGRIQGGAPVSADNDVYVGYLHNVRLGNSVRDVGLPHAPQNSVLVGGRQRIAGGGALFAEQHLQLDGSDRLLSRSVGADVVLAPGWSGSVAYERGASHTPWFPARERDALSLGTVWVSGPVSLRAGIDGRLETQAGERTVQSGGQARLEWRPMDTLTLALAGRGASTYGGMLGTTLQPRQSAWEGAIGAALRPLRDTVQAFVRYALTYERRADAQVTTGWLQQASHVAAASATLNVLSPVAISPKVAYRVTDITVDDPLGQIHTTDQALLVALRGDLHLTDRWDVGVEGRTCAVPGSSLPTRFGALAEANVLAMHWLKVGAGYNFSSVSANSVRCVEPGARGLFVRVETLY